MNDSSLYTGVDGVQDGVFGNEARDEAVEQKIQEQEQLIKELTPKLQELLDIVSAEQKLTLDFIAGYVDSTKDNDDLYRAELKAAGRYRTYLNGLKTKFTLALNEAKGKS